MRHATPASRRRRTAAAGIAAAVVLLGATACAEDSSDGGDDAPSNAAANTAVDDAPAGTFAGKVADGSEIKVGIINPEDGPAISQPEAREAAEAAVKYANENLGGIAGHKITTVVCKSKEDPASAGDCAQQMIDEKVAAVVTLNTGNGDAIVPPLAKAGIPYTSYQGASGAELATPGTYLWTGGIAAILGAEAKYAAENGVKSFAMFATDNAAVIGAIQQMGDGAFGAAGIKFTVVPIPLGNPDSTPQVSAGLKGKPDAVGVVGDANMCGGVLKAISTVGADTPKYLIPFCLEDAAVKNAGDAAYENAKVFTTATGGAADNDEAAIYRAVMAKYAPDTDIESSAKTGYQSMLGFIRAAQGLQGDPTTANVGKALAAAKDVPLPLGDGITFTCDGKQMPGLTGPCSTAVIVGTVEGAKATQYEVLK
jgi:branched-chain amino acid transport system substrate-binding protein